MDKPLVVYLDTQDYIKLFNESEDGPNHLVLAELLSARDRGEIVIGFSFATIFEFITKPDAVNRPERVRRGQLIKDICGRNAFPYPTDLLKGATFPNDGMWMFRAGEKVASAKYFREQMHLTLDDELKNNPAINRKQRRKLGRNLSPRDLVRQSGSTWGRDRSDYGNIPVSDELIQSRIFERFIKGECTDREFERRLNAWLSDPAEYSRIIYDYADRPNVITDFFGEPTAEIEKLINVIPEAISKLRDLNAEILKTRAHLVNSGVAPSEARKLTKQVSFPEPTPETFGPKLETILGRGRSGHFRHYISWVVKTGRSFKRSDVMDLFQMCYAYDCDLFRCDKDMANIFRDYSPFDRKLVSHFVDLPDRIRALVSSDNT